jgi:Second Messenger Oligonucleotide or Dinucleotide Synthetase domain
MGVSSTQPIREHLLAATTAKAFDEFNTKIVPTAAQALRVKNRAQTASGYLKEFFGADHDMPVERVSMIGSAARGTDIRPIHDIDVMAEFRNKNAVFEKYRRDSQAFIARIRNTLNANTQIKKVGARGQAVRLFYTDDLHVDIAPVFAWSGGGFALPSGSGGWITTDPFTQAKWADERQEALSGYYKRRVRMLKRWNDEHSKRLESYHLEVMVGAAFASMDGNSRDALWKFFQRAPNYLNVQDPAGHFGDLGIGLTFEQRRLIGESCASAEERARKANQAEAAANHREAIRLWRIVLGDEFPAYG